MRGNWRVCSQSVKKKKTKKQTPPPATARSLICCLWHSRIYELDSSKSVVLEGKDETQPGAHAISFLLAFSSCAQLSPWASVLSAPGQDRWLAWLHQYDSSSRTHGCPQMSVLRTQSGFYPETNEELTVMTPSPS